MRSSCSSSDESNYSPPPPSQRGSYGTACVRCRELKQKCDNSVPSCHRCAAAGTQCLRMSHEQYYDIMLKKVLELDAQIENIQYEWSSVCNSQVAHERRQTNQLFQNSGWQQEEAISARKKSKVEDKDSVPPLRLDIDQSCLMTGQFSCAEFLPFVDDEGFSPETIALHERLFECRLDAIRNLKGAHGPEPKSMSPISCEKQEKKYEWELEVTPTGIRIQTDIHGLGDLYDFLSASAHQSI